MAAETGAVRGHALPEGGGATALFVCHANICRSPMMVHLLGQEVARLHPGTPWTFLSAGTAARPGDALCSRTARVLRRAGLEVPDHEARLLTAQLVEDAAIILTASVAERSSVVHLSLEARERTFTLREAARLAALSGRVLTPTEGGTPGAADLAASLHDSRGLDTALATGRRPRGVNPLDVPDVHQGQVRSHRPVVRDVRQAIGPLAPLFARLGRPT